MDLHDMIEILEDHFMIHHEVIDCMGNIHGFNQETMEDILYWRTGNRSFDQLEDEE